MISRKNSLCTEKFSPVVYLVNHVEIHSVEKWEIYSLKKNISWNHAFSNYQWKHCFHEFFCQKSIREHFSNFHIVITPHCIVCNVEIWEFFCMSDFTWNQFDDSRVQKLQFWHLLRLPIFNLVSSNWFHVKSDMQKNFVVFELPEGSKLSKLQILKL